ncbi:hypothetical protein B0T19DRAFT_449308 [Cercophora scortea]|uniref:FAD dependent oxidoreductase n=1 Tax=Cercophora scortea TaxID=314031 RepID=A0AAE0IZA8_9PEZI|nr:hypothetical protein B0T19DRAFT_449308 [Cercophora scortea]
MGSSCTTPPPEPAPASPFGRGRSVAVIGAGISGVCTAAHLLKQGLSVTVFERSTIPGGVWHYDERPSEDPPYPNKIPSLGDYKVSKKGEFVATNDAGPPSPRSEKGEVFSQAASDPEVAFSPPGPCYAGLTTNVPTSLMFSSLDPWPEGSAFYERQQNVERYIQTIAKNHGVESVTLFRTRVDDVRKTDDGTKWEVRSVTFNNSGSGGVQLVERISLFDLVVVASGHYNMPRIPDIEGLKEWKAAFPDRVIHSKQYRDPQKYRDQNLLVIGAGVSSVDICRELDGVANKSYQSVRGGSFDLPASLLPKNATRVAEVVRFTLPDGYSPEQRPGPGQPVPGTAVLKDGRVLDDIHRLVLGTGYITSYPFLPQLHSDTAPITSASDDILVTSDGEMAHNLHKDIFFINDPTLAFVGVPYYVATFSCFDYQAQAVARVFAGKVRIPPAEEMRKEYEARVKAKGLGRGFHSLAGDGGEIVYVKDLAEWVNRDVEALGDEPMPTHSDEWVREALEMKKKMKALFEGERGR